MILQFFKNFTRKASILSRQSAKVIESVINPPKRIANAYSLFYADRFASIKSQNANLSVVEAAKQIGSEWRALDEGKKQTYQSRAAQIKSQHDAEKTTFKQNLNERQKVALSLLRLSNREGSTRWDLSKKQKSFLNEFPKTEAFTGRGLFLSQRLKGLKESSEARNAKLADGMREWHQLPASQQQSFESQAKANLDRFKSAVSSFLKK